MTVNSWGGVLVVTAAIAAVAASCSDVRRAEGEAGRPPVAVETEAARLSEVQESIEVVGALAPKRAADIKSEFTAVVAEVYVTEWAPVRAGQPLARLDTREAEAELEAVKAAVLQAEVAETRAQRELERAEKLKTAGLITQQGLDDARTAREAAAAATAAARAQQRAAETRFAKAIIRAPFDGVVAVRLVSVGDRVENMGGGPMFRVVDNRTLDLTATVPSGRLSALAVGQTVEFTSEAWPGRRFAGVISHINPAADDASRTIKVMAAVDNADGALKGGLFVKGRILTGARTQVLTVPRAALLGWGLAAHTAHVFLVEDGVARRAAVATGAAVGAAVEVTRGLAEGVPVVTRGGFNLRDGDRVVVAGA